MCQNNSLGSNSSSSDGNSRAKRPGGAGEVAAVAARAYLKVRWTYAQALFQDPNATLDDLREAVTTLEDATRIARRLLGSAHPLSGLIEATLENARAALRAHEAQGEAQDAFRTARLKLAQERSELAQTLASDYDEPD